ncbi:hypothetical protein [Streptomyces sp. NPDC017940]|uniref:hypothetical protein n=1 Tax=Streptomyces sp. NPDC017940 TaxID=3365017 RepID=UPI00379E5AB8
MIFAIGLVLCACLGVGSGFAVAVPVSKVLGVGWGVAVGVIAGLGASGLGFLTAAKTLHELIRK